jgi:hypothetical protein
MHFQWINASKFWGIFDSLCHPLYHRFGHKFVRISLISIDFSSCRATFKRIFQMEMTSRMVFEPLERFLDLKNGFGWKKFQKYVFFALCGPLWCITPFIAYSSIMGHAIENISFALDLTILDVFPIRN